MILPPEPTEPYLLQTNIPLMEEVTHERQIEHNIGLTEKEKKLVNSVWYMYFFEMVFLIYLTIWVFRSELLCVIDIAFTINVYLFFVRRKSLTHQSFILILNSCRIIFYSAMVVGNFLIFDLIKACIGLILCVIIFYDVKCLITLFNIIQVKYYTI